MVRAILDGRKTQTRRVVTAQPPKGADSSTLANVGHPWHDIFGHNGAAVHRVCCPYGQPGDRLYVRETWARDDEDGTLIYRADVGHGGDADDWQRNINEGVTGYRWRPSIHMPRWASRITLEITGVRVERLQDISEADAMAEGIEPIPCTGEDAGQNRYSIRMPGYWFNATSAVGAYRMLWESINGESWGANPWVWVISFARAQP